MLLGNRYQLIEPLRTGGMATIYVARDTALGRRVAIKRLKAELAADPGFRERFLNEACTVAALRHPHIVEVFDVDPAPERPYLVMELIEGQSLTSRLPLPADQALDLLRPVAEALAFCHSRGIVHCDIKPDNVMVDASGAVKLIDFGISLPDGACGVGPLIGSAHYVAPEQVTGGPLTPAADVYSFGIVLFQAITGIVPFDGPDAGSIARQHVEERVPLMSDVLLTVPLALERVVSRATCPAASARYRNGDALLIAIDQTRAELAGEPLPVPIARDHNICSATDFWAHATGPLPVAGSA